MRPSTGCCGVENKPVIWVCRHCYPVPSNWWGCQPVEEKSTRPSWSSISIPQELRFWRQTWGKYITMGNSWTFSGLCWWILRRLAWNLSQRPVGNWSIFIGFYGQSQKMSIAGGTCHHIIVGLDSQYRWVSHYVLKFSRAQFHKHSNSFE